MSEQLWEIANALHSVRTADRESLDTLVGCTALIISLASQIEQRGKENQDTRGTTENG